MTSFPRRRRRRRGWWHRRRLDEPCCSPRTAHSRWCSLGPETLGDGASSRTARAWSAPRAARRPRSASVCAASQFYADQRRPLPLRFGFVRQGYLDAEFHRRRSRPGIRTHRAAAVPLGLDVGVAHQQTTSTAVEPGSGARSDPWRLLCARRRLHRRAPQRAGLHRRADRVVGSTSGNGARSPDCVRRVAASSASTTSEGPIDTGRVVLTGGPQLAEVGARDGCPGSPRAGPGTRSSSPRR